MSMLDSGRGVCVFTDPHGNITQVYQVNGEPVPWGTVAEVKSQLTYLPEMDAELRKLKHFRVIPYRMFYALWDQELQGRVGAWASLPVVTEDLWKTIYNRMLQAVEAVNVRGEVFRDTGDWKLAVGSSATVYNRQGDIQDKVAKFCGFPSQDVMYRLLTPEQVAELDQMKDDLDAGKPVYPK